MKCELCGKIVDKLYWVRRAEDCDFDEDGPHIVYGKFKVCDGCLSDVDAEEVRDEQEA